ncbi:DUF397 domain-containing protein [Actinomadura alba]|uniref:DUF397 domain-containing protein n=1 Tax=Actinomadura alba TaxID=406431 RepID=A0ABR7LMA4_9ACTN|nr:DUF397 domain-containing protein [Actinomadura alba]MBC6465977.1 DUF397 domain-containing protein [Actinomadura alba]
MSYPNRSATQWRKSIRSGGQGGECVEIAGLPRVVAVRDSKDPDGPRLTFSPAAWRAFSADAKNGAFDL